MYNFGSNPNYGKHLESFILYLYYVKDIRFIFDGLSFLALGTTAYRRCFPEVLIRCTDNETTTLK